MALGQLQDPCPGRTDTDRTWIDTQGTLMLGPIANTQSKDQVPGFWDISQPLGNSQPVVKLDHDHPDNLGWTSSWRPQP